MAIIPACHAGDPSSILGCGGFFINITLPKLINVNIRGFHKRKSFQGKITIIKGKKTFKLLKNISSKY